MAFDPRLAERQLIELYRRAYLNLLDAIARGVRRGNVTGFERAMLDDVASILRELDTQAKRWVEQVVPKLYREGRVSAVDVWRKAGLTPPAMSVSFANVHRDAVRILAENLYDNLSDANRFVGRRIMDAWRRAQLETIAEKLPEGQTWKQARRRLLERVASDGLGAFVDRRGRTWRMDGYAEMSVRSVTAEAQNLGTMNQLKGMGYDLVKMTDHLAPCPVCAIYEGRVYSLTGETPGYPHLSVVPGFGEGYSVIHPNCRHRVTPYIPSLANDPEADRNRSNAPLTDPRSEAEKRRYENEQREKRMRREIERLAEQVRIMPPGPERDRLQARLTQLRRDRAALRRELGIA